ncbi:MAG: class I SAM-dependent RNA methyltransferase [Desulfuromonadales bacterium]|nr:class I SAM-dependent RNA methyltransferase [Desulfuromonadales bacterium]MBN2792723.1 class I SAM-dependent RNA methyltransferase [Desulfuromonadales bacterium]
MRNQPDDYFIVTAPGFEKICARELHDLGIQSQNLIRGGVEFSGGLRELYLANLWLRSASRILVRVGSVTARDFPTLFQRLARLPWGRFIKPGMACDVKVAAHKSRLLHSGRIAETCLEAISHALGEVSPGSGSGQKVLIRLSNNQCQVSVDSSGEHLHRRGYRSASVRAPLRETLAAGCLLACGYDGSQAFFDLMTGSGTFAIEAALIALRRAPGHSREFAFMDWPKYRPGLWQQLRVEAQKEELSTLPNLINAVDSNPKAVEAAQRNLAGLGLEGAVQLFCGEMQQLTPPAVSGLLICNPPYGERLGKNATLAALYHDLGHLYNNRFPGWEGAILCPETGLLDALGTNFIPLLRFSNGGVKVALFKKVPRTAFP